MEFKDIVSVTGKAGLYQMLAPRDNGMVAVKIGETKKSFLSTRKHNFTLLESIGIYLDSGETVELSSVLKAMTNQGSVPKQTDKVTDIINFFSVVVPNYDQDRVKLSDMKKILQWYWIMDEHDLLKLIPEEGANSNEEE